MLIEEFNYEKDGKIEKRKVMVVKDTPKYIEGYSIKNDEVEELYDKLVKYYRRYKKEKITDKQYYPGYPFGLLGSKFDDYCDEVDIDSYSKEEQEEIRFLMHNIYSNLNDLARLLNKKYKN